MECGVGTKIIYHVRYKIIFYMFYEIR